MQTRLRGRFGRITYLSVRVVCQVRWEAPSIFYDGTVYTSYSVTQSFPPASWAPGATATLGWIWGASDASSTNAFMNGDGNRFYVSIPFGRINLMGAVTLAYGGSTAIELGITSPAGITVGVAPWSRSTPINGK